jgi:hypothetical protein
MNGRRSVQRLRPSRRLRPVGARRGTSMVEVLVYVLCVAMLTNMEPGPQPAVWLTARYWSGCLPVSAATLTRPMP